MKNKEIEMFTKDACASIRYRFRKEILEEKPDIGDYLDEILADKRVQYVLSWQTPEGFLGRSFHGGWIPDAKLKYYNTGSEAALRFLSEMAVPSDNPVVERCLNRLVRDDWKPDPWKWSTVYEPEKGLYGGDHIRSVVFVYFGIEEHDFIRTEIQRTLDILSRVTKIQSVNDIAETYQGKLFFSKGFTLPDVYHLKLLAFTQGWKSENTTTVVAKEIEHLIELSPLPHIYIKCGSQLVAPADATQHDFKLSPRSLQPKSWYFWLHNMELFARMGIVRQIPLLRNHAAELKAMLEENDGLFPLKPYPDYFQKWSVYTGLALEESWSKNRRLYDLTFRVLLILKYAGVL